MINQSVTHRHKAPRLRAVEMDDDAIVAAATLWHELEDEIDRLLDRKERLAKGELAEFREVHGIDPRGTEAGAWLEFKNQLPRKYAVVGRFEAPYVASGLGTVDDRLCALWSRQDPISDALKRASPASPSARAARASVMAAIALGLLYSFTDDDYELAAAEIAVSDLKLLASR